jgi:hypothetical protein
MMGIAAVGLALRNGRSQAYSGFREMPLGNWHRLANLQWGLGDQSIDFLSKAQLTAYPPRDLDVEECHGQPIPAG